MSDDDVVSARRNCNAGRPFFREGIVAVNALRDVAMQPLRGTSADAKSRDVIG